jgi:hypothetical protein
MTSNFPELGNGIVVLFPYASFVELEYSVIWSAEETERFREVVIWVFYDQMIGSFKLCCLVKP